VRWTVTCRKEITMSTTIETTEPRNDIERLLEDMVASDNMEFSVVSGGHFFSVGLGSLARETLHCSCHADVWIASTSGLTIYAWPSNTKWVRFVRGPDPQPPLPKAGRGGADHRPDSVSPRPVVGRGAGGEGLN